MSIEATSAIRFDGVGRYHTEIKVLVHSHLHAEPIDISQDVMVANTHKGVKSEGKANLTLTGSRNYLSLIYPNDYINIYFNIGDGNGWVRNFFGFIDRVQESYKVADSGIPVATYTIACTDFQKAIDKTQIYTNPHILGRRDTVSQAFGTPNIGGVVLMGNGVRAHGSPADLVLNFLYIFMGFASQYLLPESYNPAFLERYREQRREYLLRSVAPRIREVIEGEGGFEAFLQGVEEDAAESVATIDSGEGDLRSPEEVSSAFRARTSALLEERLGGLDRMGQVVAAYDTTAADAPATLLDIVDTTTFVEREAIDGWTFSETIWQQQGSVWSLLTAQSNEMVNEMFFDLRPKTVESASGGLTNSEDYSRASDEIQGNVGGNGPDGPQYVPALIMREYPFSTINYIDASTVPTGLRNAAGEDEFFGTMYLGAIFSHEPNRPGRHVVEMPNLSVDDRINGRAAGAAFKHLDVVVVDQNEIIESDLGRFDYDYFNLIEAISSDVIGQQASFIMSAELPIISPIHIIRHGLRTRRLDSKFARFDRHSVQSARGATNAVRNAPVREEEAPDGTIGSHPDPQDMRSEPNWRLLDRLWRAYEPYGCRGMNEYVLARTMHSEYRADTSDVVAGGAAAITEHTVAVAWCAKNIAQTGYKAGGGRRGEGRVRPYRNGTSSTTNIAEAIMPSGVPGRNGGRPADEIRSRPQVTSRFPGDISTLDSESISVYDREAMAAIIQSGSIDDHVARHFASNPNEETLVRAYFDVAREVLNGSRPDPAASRGAGGSITFFHSSHADMDDDPRISDGRVARFERRGFRHYRIDPVGSAGSYSHIFARPEINNAGESTESTPAETGSEATRARSTAGAVDSSMARAQLFRWALMHDHWYQHNLEYLSGSFMMRGNPSIRPGYRLDIRDRNLSFYVEAAGQQFHYPNKLTTTVEVSRGQPNNPFPVYVLPNTSGFNPTESQRLVGSRLDKYFAIQDTPSTQKAVVFRNHEFAAYDRSPNQNFVDAEAVDSSTERVVAANYMDINNVLDLQAEDLDAQLAELNALLDAETVTSGGGGVDGAVPESGLTSEQLASRRELEIL